MSTRIILSMAALAAALAFTAPAARSDDATISGFVTSGSGMVRIPVTSMFGARYLGIVRQHTDYSCGAASVATILKYVYDMSDVTESSVIEGMLKVSDPNLVRQRGFSLLDIKNYVDSLHLIGAGYKITFDQLLTVKVPTILLIDEDGYQHFVVFRKATPQYVFVADPIRGNQAIRADIFNGAWNGVLFVIEGTSYDANNPLTKVQAPPSMTQMANGIPSSAEALDSAVLQNMYIPGIDRL